MKKYYYGIIIGFLLIYFVPINIFAAWECPEAKFKTIPEGMTSPGQEIKLQAYTEGYSVRDGDEEAMLYGWCVDNVFLNTIVAGSDDEILKDETDGSLYLANKYGEIRENLSGACSDNWHLYEDKDDGDADKGTLSVTGPSGSGLKYGTDANRITTVPQDLIVYREPNPGDDSDGDGLGDSWEIKYFKGRKIEATVYINAGPEGFHPRKVSFYMSPDNEAEILSMVTPEGIIVPPNPDLVEETSLDGWSEDGRYFYTTTFGEIKIPDPDGDGWSYPFSDGWYFNEEYDNEIDHYTPYIAGFLGVGNYGAPWMALIPQPAYSYEPHRTMPIPLSKDSKYDENVWNIYDLPKDTILFEWVRGTDPLNPDTDSDGIEDVADYAGIQQDNINLKIKDGKENGDKYNFALKTLGVSDAFRNGDVKRDNKYWFIFYPYTQDVKDSGDYEEEINDKDIHKNNEVKGDIKAYEFFYPHYSILREFRGCRSIDQTPQGENEIEVGSNLPLKIGLGYRPSPPISGEEEPVTVTAETLQGSEMANTNLNFQWYVDDEPKEGKSGDGKQYFQYKQTAEVCDDNVVTLEAREENGQLTSQDLAITTGFDVDLKAEVIGSVNPISELAVNFNQHIGSDFEYSDLENPYDIPDFMINGNDPFRDLINGEDEGRGFRTWDLIKVTADGLSSGVYGDACKEQYGDWQNPLNADDTTTIKTGLNTFNFLWNFTRKEQTLQNGKGLNFREAYFILKGEPRKFEDKTGGADEYSLTNESSEWVDFEMTDASGKVMAKNTVSFPIFSPTVKILETENVIIGTSSTDSEKEKYYATPGDQVWVKMGWRYFRPAEEFNIIWKRNGVIADEQRIAGDSNITSSTFSFRAGYDINGNPIDIDKEDISLSIESNIMIGERPVTETSDGAMEIELGSPEVEAVDTALGGALQNLIPKYYKNIFNLFAIGGMAGIALLFVLSFMNKAGKRK